MTRMRCTVQSFIVATKVFQLLTPKFLVSLCCFTASSLLGEAPSHHFRPNKHQWKSEVFTVLKAAKRLLKKWVSVFSLVFIPCPKAHPDRHLCLLPPEREANYWTKLEIKLSSCPYEGTVPLEQGLGLIRRVVERKGVSSLQPLPILFGYRGLKWTGHLIQHLWQSLRKPCKSPEVGVSLAIHPGNMMWQALQFIRAAHLECILWYKAKAQMTSTLVKCNILLQNIKIFALAY